VEIQACVRGAPAKCLAAASDMDRLHIKRRLEHTARDLRARALVILDEQCRMNDGEACVKHGKELVHDGEGPDVTHGFKEVERGCSLGFGQACLYLGDHYQDGLVVRQDARLAAALYERACESGSARGCEQLALHLAPAEKPRI